MVGLVMGLAGNLAGRRPARILGPPRLLWNNFGNTVCTIWRSTISRYCERATLPLRIKSTLDYEEGRTSIDEAAKSGDLVLRDDLLKDAREKLEGFVKANPNSPRPARPLSISPSS